MSIGYACLTVGVRETQFKSCVQKNATAENLLGLIEHNLGVLDHIIDYNAGSNIQLFRISSDIIPFGSSPVNSLPWAHIFAEQLAAIGLKARTHRIRLSMHPGQYTVLNSPHEDVAGRAVEDLRYHTLFLDSLGVDSTHKIVLHIGGVYNDKPAAMRRFQERYAELDPAIKKRLVLENDDKLFTISDVLETAAATGMPVVYDNLHNEVNPADPTKNDSYWIEQAAHTWRAADGLQKIHYAQQDILKKRGSHSPTIRIGEFLEFYNELPERPLDIMLEVKDKNLSAVKCINCTSPQTIQTLEVEWSRYKYTVLEHAPDIYQEIRRLLKDKAAYPAGEFYELIERALSTQPTLGTSRNATQHVWGYFKDVANDKEKAAFAHAADSVIQKRLLHKLALKYQEPYLLASYYFGLP